MAFSAATPYDPTAFLKQYGIGDVTSTDLSALGSGTTQAAPAAFDLSTPMGGTKPPMSGLPALAGAGGSGFGWNMDTAKLGLGGLQTLGNLYASLSALGLAKDQFKYTKGVTDTNLNNSIQSYNTTLEDRATSRAAQNGTSSADLAAYLDKNRLTR